MKVKSAEITGRTNTRTVCLEALLITLITFVLGCLTSLLAPLNILFGFIPFVIYGVFLYSFYRINQKIQANLWIYLLLLLGYYILLMKAGIIRLFPDLIDAFATGEDQAILFKIGAVVLFILLIGVLWRKGDRTSHIETTEG